MLLNEIRTSDHRRVKADSDSLLIIYYLLLSYYYLITFILHCCLQHQVIWKVQVCFLLYENKTPPTSFLVEDKAESKKNDFVLRYSWSLDLEEENQQNQPTNLDKDRKTKLIGKLKQTSSMLFRSYDEDFLINKGKYSLH